MISIQDAKLMEAGAMPKPDDITWDEVRRIAYSQPNTPETTRVSPFHPDPSVTTKPGHTRHEPKRHANQFGDPRGADYNITLTEAKAFEASILQRESTEGVNGIVAVGPILMKSFTSVDPRFIERETEETGSDISGEREIITNVGADVPASLWNAYQLIGGPHTKYVNIAQFKRDVEAVNNNEMTEADFVQTYWPGYSVSAWHTDIDSWQSAGDLQS